MLFNSFSFLFFFPVVTVVYFLLPQRYRWFHLLIASCIFYMAFKPVYILIIFSTILVDYFSGLYIEKTDGKKKKALLIFSLSFTILILIVFKYFNFLNANVVAINRLLHWNYPLGVYKILLPIGLSFHTFQGMSYIIEVYRGRQKAESNFGMYALYVMFFPQLVAGPIERPQNMLHQFYEEHKFEYQRVVDGLKLMTWGMFKKVVIADRLAVMVNMVYSNVRIQPSSALFFATLFFSFQIYCDFSGYSDIAIGAAKIMGFRLMKNFDRPYFSKSISEFWKRWHISLSSWFKDYLFIPLGGNRVSVFRWCLNIFIVFLISGIWHGANWTFIVWGALHGFFMIFSIVTKKLRERIRNLSGVLNYPFFYKIFQILFTFSIVTFSWIFFRANNLNDAFYIVKNILSLMPEVLLAVFKFDYKYLLNFVSVLSNIGLFWWEVLIAIVALVILNCVQLVQRRGSIIERLNSKSVWFRWVLYYGLVVAIIIFGQYDSGLKQFIYFQF